MLGRVELRAIPNEGRRHVLLEAGKPLALIARLSAAPNRTTSREHLVGLLWANLDPPEARRALRQTLWFIKRKTDSEIITGTNDYVTLDPRVESDRDGLIAAWDDGDFEEVVRRYTGDLLTDFAAPGADEFEAWAEDERRRLRSIFIHAAEAVVRDCTGRGAYRDAQTLARRVRDLDPLNQAGWRLLLECLVASDDRAATAIEAGALERLLEAEEIEPEAATRDALRIARGTRRHPGSADVDTGQHLTVDLVGRERQFAELRSAWDQARNGRAGFFHIVAPAGLGKTRLLSDLRARLRVSKGCIVHARATYAGRDIPYSFASDVAAALADCPGAIGVSPQSASNLIALNPSLSSVYAATTDSAKGEEALRRRALALRELVITLTEERPVAILLDDLHWADAESARLLQSALAGIDRHRVLVASAARHTAPTLLSDRATTLTLHPLTADQVASLVTSVALLPDEDWANTFPSALCTATDGSPLLVLDTLQLLIERQVLTTGRRAEGEATGDPFWRASNQQALAEVLGESSALHRRIAALDSVARSVLLALAVAGTALSDARLRVAVGSAGSAIAAALQDLEKRGLVVRNAVDWTITHDEYASTILAATPDEIHCAMAGIVGRAIAESTAGDSRELRVAASLLATGRDTRALEQVYRRFVKVAHASGDNQPDAIARDLLGPLADARLVDSLVRSLPGPLRLQLWFAKPSSLAAAAALMAVLGIGAATAWVRAHPEPKPDAVLVARRVVPDRARIEDFAVPIDASRWAGVGLLDVRISGSPRWTIHTATGTNGSAPVPRPDGRGWTFGRMVPDTGVVDIVDIDLKGHERRLTFARGDDNAPSWAPDNSAFAFTTMRWADRARYDIAIYDTATRAVRQLTRGPEIDGGAQWSPDGSRIGFIRQWVPNPGHTVCIMDADGENLRCLKAERGMRLGLLGWSDAHHVVTWGAEAHRLSIIDVEADSVELIDAGAAAPLLSPDGKWVVCTCARRGYPAQSWFVFPLQRPNEFKLLRIAGSKSEGMTFDWAPDSPRAPYIQRLRVVAGVGSPILGIPYQLRVAGEDRDGRPIDVGVVRWRSLDTTIASVDSAGLVIPHRRGTAVIEASAGGWRQAVASLYVEARSTDVLFEERWSSGLSPAWRPYGDPRPEVVDDARLGRAFWNHGDQAFYSGAHTVASFPTAHGVWVDLLMSSPVTATEWQRNVVGLFAVTDSAGWSAWDHVHGDMPGGSVAKLCHLSYPIGRIGTPPIDAIDGGPGRGLMAPPDGFGSGRPFRVVLQILPDGRCGCAIDGRVVWLTPVNFTEQAVHVMLAGNSVGTRMLIGRLRVSTGVAPGIDWGARGQ